MINALHVLKKTGLREFKPSDLFSHGEKRNLSFKRKICIIKIFLISQLVYIMQVFVMLDHVLVDNNRLLCRLCGEKKDCTRKAFEKVKRVVVCNDFEF